MEEEDIFGLEWRHSFDPRYLRQNDYSSNLKITYTLSGTLDLVSL